MFEKGGDALLGLLVSLESWMKRASASTGGFGIMGQNGDCRAGSVVFL